MQVDKITKVGRYFLAIPMIVFGIQHFLYAQFVVQLVPAWIPAPMFWTYFAGIGLFSAGVGIVVNVLAKLAAALLGLMISIWVMILHIPRIFQFPGDNEFINVFNALFMLSGAYILSASLPGKVWTEKISGAGAKVAPILIVISIVVFGIENLIHQRLVFIVGASYYEVPAAAFWINLSALVFIAAAVGIAIRKKTRLVAFGLGVYILFITFLFYAPQLFINMYDAHTWATLLKGIAMSGSAFILSDAVSKEYIPAVGQGVPLP
jgi:uncharacterized membrane protein YphA (DoxX/SURF4 family)